MDWARLTGGSEGLTMHYILFYDVVDDFIAKRVTFRNEHLALARQAHDRGDLVLAGALADPVDGAVLVFRGSSPQPAEAFAQLEPYVTHRLLHACPIRRSMNVDP